MKILLVSFGDGDFAPMLAARLARNGFRVEALCPASHILALSNAIERLHRLSWTRSAASIRAAIASSRPTLVIPCDDPARYALAGLHRMCAVRDDASSREIATTIERSLGRPEHWRLAEEKSQLLASLGGSDIRCPRTILAESPRELDRICETLSFPLVLKRDRTFGGQGVLFCHGKDETRAAFERLAAAPTLRDTMRSVVYASDLGALNRYFNPPVPVIAAQAHVEGQPANRAVACCEGEVLAGVTVVAVETNPRPYGPAAVVRIVENAAIDESARIIARRLGLSGICGFDFVIEARTGDAYFIELNARATPTCHIGRARDSDVCGALARRWGAIGDVDDAVDSRDHSDPIPVFPAEWRRDPNSPHLGSPHHGVPWSNPAVVAAFALAQATQSDPARRTAVSNLLDRLARRRLVRRR